MRFRNLAVCLSVAVCLLAMGTTAVAQSAGTGALIGTLTDPSGGSIPNATVTLTNNQTNQVRTTTTGTDGSYRFTLIPPGSYKVRFSATGFKTAEVLAFNVNVTETPVLDRTLEVGAQTEQITVEVAAETLQTATSSLGTTFGTRTVTELPLASRNYTQIVGLSAGASVDVNNATLFGKGTQDMSVNGNNPGQNNFQMDGVQINNIANRGSANDFGIYGGVAIANPDAVQEFKIQTSTYDASYGRNPGANVNVVTKSGTNAWHGSAFEFFRNAHLNANDFFYNRDNPNSRTTKQVLNQNQFGGALGGPIKHDKVFIFGSYQGTRSRNGVDTVGKASMLLPGIPTGDRTSSAWLRQLIANNCGPTAPSLTPGFLPCSATTVSTPALRILQLKNPDGSFFVPTTGDFPKQTSFSVPAVYQDDQVIVNGDWVVNSKNTLATRYFYSRQPRTVSLVPLIGGGLPGTTQNAQYDNTDAVLKLTTLVTPSFINEARASFQRNLAATTDTLPAGATPQALGITPLVSTYTQAPPISLIINGFTMFGTLDPSYSPTSQFQYADQISWTHGKHTLRAGYEFEKTQWNLVFGGLGRGWLLMGSFTEFLNGTILQCLFCVRGGPDGIIHAYRLPNQNAYVQDDWRISPKLTVNLGVRWEYMGTLSDHFGNLTNTWISRLGPNSAVPNAPLGQPGNYAGFVVPSNFDTKTWGNPPNGILRSDSTLPIREHPPYSNFAPRLGIAWQATNKLVVRGGAGIFYERAGMDRFVHSVQEGNPYAATVASIPGVNDLANPYPAQPALGTFGQRWANFQTGQTSAINRPFLNEVIHTPLTRQYNLGLQYEFARLWIFEAAYVGSSSINLTDYNHNYNLASVATPSRPVNGVTTTTVLNRDLRVPYLGFGASTLQGTAFDGISNYNSLQLTVRKQFSHGFNLQAAYTYSKSLSNVFNSAANSNFSMDMAQQYGPTDFNRPQRFVFNYGWDLPFGQHAGALGKIAEGWNLSGVTVIQDGAWMTLTDIRGGTAYSNPQTNIEGGYSRPQMCAGKTYADIPSSGDIRSRLGGASGGPGYYNVTGVFCAPTVIGDPEPITIPPLGLVAGQRSATEFGNAGVGILQAPSQLNFDFSVLKSTRITERQSIQFRAEFFNIFNHPQFGPPGPAPAIGNYRLPNVASPTDAWITQTSVNPRIIQFALKYIF